MTRAVALALILAGAAACGGDKPAKITRTDRNAPSVAVVDRQPGGGATPTSYPTERERNDAIDPAMAPIDGGVTAVLDGAADVDVFAVVAPGDRALDATLGGAAGIDLALDVIDGAGATVVTIDRGGVGAGERLPNWPLAAGRYYLRVREIAHRPKLKKGVDAPPARTGASPPYTLAVALAADAAPGAEREPDDDRGTAGEVALGAPVTGYLGWTGDVDVWKLDVDGLAAGDGLDLAVTAIPKVALTIEITDAAGRRLVRQSGAAGAPIELRSIAPRVAPGEPSTHYLHISGKPSSGDHSYQLTIASRVLELDEESEPNDRADRANPLRAGDEDAGTMKGQLGPGEVDRFALSPSPEPMTLDVVVEAPPDVDLVAVASGGATGTGVRAGDRVQLAGLAVTPGQPVALVITGSRGKAMPGPYRLRWSLSTPSAPDPVDDPMPPEQ